MTTTRFADLTLARLTAAGWYEGRTTDVTSDLKVIRNSGIEVLAPAESFLREFSGLNPIQREAAGVFSEVRMLFNAIKAIDDVGPEWITSVYSPALKAPLTPVGLAENNYMMLMLDAHADLYGGWDQDVFYFGPIAQGLDELFAGGHGTLVYSKS